MCEHQDEIHKLDNQLGSIMRFDDKKLKNVRPFLVWGLQVITMLMKIGEQAAGGFSNMVSELERAMLMGIIIVGVPKHQEGKTSSEAATATKMKFSANLLTLVLKPTCNY